MLQAEFIKLRSNCITKHVGAVIVCDHKQIATGYNGTPPGIKNCFDGGCFRCHLRMQEKIVPSEGLERCICNHAEANAIMHCTILGVHLDTKNVTLYTTFVTCLECSKMAVTIGIKRIVCLNSYSETDYKFLQDAGIEVVLLEKERMKYWMRILLDEDHQ